MLALNVRFAYLPGGGNDARLANAGGASNTKTLRTRPFQQDLSKSAYAVHLVRVGESHRIAGQPPGDPGDAPSGTRVVTVGCCMADGRP